MKTILRHSITFFQKETVLCIAGLLALITAFIVPPSATYLKYLDFRVLSLLFCLMLVVAGLQSIGVFHSFGTRLLSGIKNTHQLVLLLTGLSFVSSMFITNDVALITFVPFGIMIMQMAHQEKLFIPVIVLQTIAANLGSMMTPIGNPQNLYLYSVFSISMGDFLTTMLPLTLLSLILLFIAIIFLPNETLSIGELNRPDTPAKKPFLIYLFLFFVCIACVLHIISFQVMLFIVVCAILFVDRTLLKKADYNLLLTFVCFFLFIGNMQQIPMIAEFFRSLIAQKELLLGILLSQFISNVPAAILLSGFTENFVPLLYGVNIGGLGTLIASLASLISYRCYGNSDGAKKGAYFKVFTIYNVVFLVVLAAAGYVITK